MVKGKKTSTTSYHKLILYQKAKELVLEIYKITQKYPDNEKYNLISQTKRTGVSVMANIVEGYVKGSSAEYSRFLTISIGSLAEVEVLLDLALDLRFIDESDFNKLYNLICEVRKLLYETRKSARLKD